MTTTATPITSTLVRRLVTAAVAAPSVHNTQPWIFRSDHEHLQVYADPTRQLKEQDPDGRAMLISCGAALLNLRLAALHHGRSPEVTILPDAADPLHVASVALGGQTTPTAMADELFAAIPHRHTNRMPYEDRPVPDAVIHALAEAARQDGANLYAVREPVERRRLIDLIHDADSVQGRSVVDETQRWTAVPSTRRDGVPSESLGPIPHDPATPHRDLAAGRRLADRGFAVFERDPTLAVLTTPFDNPRAWIMAGQALQRVLLVATVEGLVASFANQPLEEPQLRWLVRDPDQPIGFAQMLFRIGYAPPAPATPRRPVEDVIVNN